MKKNFFLEEEFSKPIPSSRYGLWTSSQSFIMMWVSYAETLLPPPPPSLLTSLLFPYQEAGVLICPQLFPYYDLLCFKKKKAEEN